MSKRIVFLHPDGLAQIMGVLDGELPVTAGPFEVLGRVVPFASLVKVRRGAAYYKEPMLPTSGADLPRGATVGGAYEVSKAAGRH